MAKIDVTTIPGYETMSDAEKLVALTDYDVPDLTGYVKKTLLDATASELAALKKKQRETESDASKKATDQAAVIENMQKQIDALQKRETVATYKANFLSHGYEDKLATDAAEALVEGDMTKFFTNLGDFITAHDKAYKATLMSGNTPPPAGKETVPTMTLDAFKKLSTADRYKFAQEHPDEYKTLYTGGTT